MLGESENMESLSRLIGRQSVMPRKQSSPKVALPVQNLLIAVQPHFRFCASLSSVFSVRAGARRTEDFGTAGHHQA